MTQDELVKEEVQSRTGDEDVEDEKIPKFEAELAEAKDQLLRRTADVDNMRRRHQAERVQLIFEANKRLITDLLGTLDDLERTLSFVKPEDKNPLADGVIMIHKNLQKVLESYGVKTIESVGAQFDVALHDALMEEERADVEPGQIITEIQKGYMLNNDVLRHSKVIVAKGA